MPAAPSPNRHRSAVVLIVLISAGGSPPAFAAGPARCDPSPAGVEARRMLAEIVETCGDWEDCRRRRLAALEPALSRSPDDVFLLEMQQDALRPAPDEPTDRKDAFLDRYKRLLDKEPDSALALYLYGRARPGIDATIELLRRAAEREPGFPWAHHGLALAYLGGRRGEDKARDHVDAFLRLCPDAPEIYELERLGPLQENVLPKLRALLERRTDERTLPYFEHLWVAEFRLLSPDRHEEVRERIRGDLERLAKLKLETRLAWWRALAEGHKLVGDAEGRTAAQRSLIDRFPCHREAASLRYDSWRQTLPRPGDQPGRAADRRSLYDASHEWVTRCPDSLPDWRRRFDAAVELTDLSNDELAGAVEPFLRLWDRNRPPGGFTIPSLYHRAAEAYVDRSIKLDLAEEWIRKGIEEDEKHTAARVRPGVTGARRRKDEEFRASVLWRGLSLQARAVIKRGTGPNAEASLAKLQAFLAANAPADKEGEGPHRAREVDLLRVKAEWAEARGRHADAFAFYLAFLRERPTHAAVRRAAEKRWRELGGGAEGWRSLMPVERSEAVPVVPPGGWSRKDQPLAAFELPDVAGRTWTLRDLSGRAAFINVWAIWCAPCVAEMPYVQQIHERLKGRDDVVLLTLNVDDDRGLVAPFLKEKGYTFPALFAGDWIETVTHTTSIPRTWIVDAAGKLRYEQTGFVAAGAERWVSDVLERLESVAAAKPAGR